MSKKLKRAMAGAVVALALMLGVIWGTIAPSNGSNGATEAGVVWSGAAMTHQGVIWGGATMTDQGVIWGGAPVASQGVVWGNSTVTSQGVVWGG